MDPFLRKKWDHVFNVFFDIKGSEMIEWEDFEILIEKIRIMRHAEQKDVDLATKALLEIWQGLLDFADLDQDGKISLYEWHEMWKASVTTKAFPKWQDTYLQYTFSLLDTSGDGMIDCSEYVEVMMLYGIDPVEAEEAFEKFAVTEEGKQVNMIGFNQFCALWNEYFHSRDPEAPGNYLFGMILEL